MDWTRYKALSDAPHVFSRWMLEQTRELVGADEALCGSLAAALAATPLEKPADHKGDAATDMIELDLDPSRVAAIVALVSSAAARGMTTSGTRRRGLGGFTAAWREYGEKLSVVPTDTDC